MTAEPGAPTNGSIDRMLRVMEDFAKAVGEITEANRQSLATSVETRAAITQHTALLERIAEILERIETDQKQGRGAAVSELKQHIDQRTKAGGWQSMAAWVFAGSATIGAAALAALATLRAIGR